MARHAKTPPPASVPAAERDAWDALAMAAGSALLAGREPPGTGDMVQVADAAALFADLVLVRRRQRFG